MNFRIFYKENRYLQYINPLSDHTLTMNITYEQSYNIFSHQTLESLQYNAALVITDAICGTSKEKLYNKFGLE